MEFIPYFKMTTLLALIIVICAIGGSLLTRQLFIAMTKSDRLGAVTATSIGAAMGVLSTLMLTLMSISGMNQAQASYSDAAEARYGVTLDFTDSDVPTAEPQKVGAVADIHAVTQGDSKQRTAVTLYWDGSQFILFGEDGEELELLDTAKSAR